MIIHYRPGWVTIFKSYGGFEKWRAAKVASLLKKGEDRMAEWYRTSTVLEIGRRDGQISQIRRYKR
jgi:hypothetical protein